MTDTTCPHCDAPAPARARRCSGCGYRFVEDGGAPRPPRPSLGAVGVGAAALAAVAVAAVLVVGAGGGGDDDALRGRTPVSHLEVLSQHPLATRAAERLLEERFITIRDDDSASVRCSGRVPKPAHSVRRCSLRYPGGTVRTVVLLTTANGAEVLSER
jgi:hypothetical protein